MDSLNILLLIAIMIPVFISLMFVPYLTRKTESFGVTIPEEVYHYPEIKSMRKQYVFVTGILSTLVMIVFFLLGSMFENNEEMMSIWFGILIGAYIVCSFIVYLVFHHNMKKMKHNEDWSEKKSQLVVIDTGFRKQKLNHSNLWFIIPFFAAIATMVITFQNYHLIPDKIPMQYNLDGEVTNWTDKTYKSVLMMPIMQVYLILLFLFINTMIAKAKQQVSAENPKESMRKNVIFRKRWSAYIIITGIAITLLFSFIQLSFIYPINQQLLTILPLVISIGIIAGAIVLSFTTGQGGSRLKTSEDINGNVIDRDDDRYWKLGQFYFNKNDPALFLEKRFGVGWTINFARPSAWIMFLVIIGLAVGIPVLLGI
ncbi:DUF1648 domain-containing protein [Virgibacillus oceani]|uniref:Membrane protein n=1 Tax=Virgibacillus oceani TaxID=1479511 RepID=A0A917HIZ1_9BACI|nr:DUF5808 domain-containing protein [Virgibacillus oceani]GGG80590.1 membrane protein [Virgibacillus oceani]